MADNNTAASESNEGLDLDYSIASLKPADLKEFYKDYKAGYGQLPKLLEDVEKGLEVKPAMVQLDAMTYSLQSNVLYWFVTSNEGILGDPAKRQQFLSSEGGALSAAQKEKVCAYFAAYKRFLSVFTANSAMIYRAIQMLPTAYEIIETKIMMELFGVDGKFIEWFKKIFMGFDKTIKVFSEADPKEVIFNYYSCDDPHLKRITAVKESIDRIMKERHPDARDFCTPCAGEVDWLMINHANVIDVWSKSFRENGEEHKKIPPFIEELKKIRKLFDDAENECKDEEVSNIYFDMGIVLDRMINILSTTQRYMEKFNDSGSTEAPYAAFHYSSEVRDVISKHGLNGGDPLKSGTRYKEMSAKMREIMTNFADKLERSLYQQKFYGVKP